MAGRAVKWGVLGTAGIAKGCTIPGMQLAQNCILEAIAGRSLEKAEAYKEMFGFNKAYKGYEALLADPEIEAVYIPLPNHLHYEWIMKAIEAGKHILCEKPLAPTRKECEELFAAAKAKGVILMEAFAYLHSPYIAAVKEELDKGTIGKVGYIETAFLTSDYDMTNIRMNRETFGGCTYDLGCYCTSMIVWMLDRLPKEVRAAAEFSEDHVDMMSTGFMNFGDGVRAHFTSGMIFETEMGRRHDRLYIHGDEGCIKSDTEFNQAGELSFRIIKDGREEIRTVSAPQNYSLEVAQLGRCITDGEKPHVSEAFTLMNAQVLDEILNKIGY